MTPRRARFLFSSSACVYPQHLQAWPPSCRCKEEDAFPADPEDGYGLEKLYGEALPVLHRGLRLSDPVVRFHNVYGPLGTYDGGSEKAPAAICRKVAVAQSATTSRSGATASRRAPSCMSTTASRASTGSCKSDYPARSISAPTTGHAHELVDIVAEIAGKTIVKRFNTNRPQGVRGRNSDNTRLRQVLNWSRRSHCGKEFGRLMSGLNGTFWARKAEASMIAAE